MDSSGNLTVIDAIGIYISSLKAATVESQSRQELLRFAQWCGSDRIISNVEPSLIEEYGTKAASSATRANAAERIKEVRKFLAFARKEGLIEQNLSQHLRTPKSKSSTKTTQSKGTLHRPEITAAGRTQIEKELNDLKQKRGPLGEEISLAAADKDVRENAPLEAAREQLGQLESRIAELENTLETAAIVDTSGKRSKTVKMGSTIVLKDLGSGKETTYTLVSAFEANPLEGKISDVSPVGKALVDESLGQQVSVATPRGVVRYQIKRITS